MAPMNVNLTLEQEKLVRALVESGQYGSLSEVFRSALRLLLAEHRKRGDLPLPEEGYRTWTKPSEKG